ncbi:MULTISPECIES: DUF4124 domain-containing protein [unclassified Lysobacter]|uniref:DUF4124 domain-containing protein n=1 Tax=unclassified Lysobacter TaxID=2635362 RepID=UPI000700DB67|nr:MULTISPECIES: DUF4124 domain-containing protein [unclassified Lysobacter]KQZ56992.1 hypothetical protein ASD53_10925 [Lysobacter sp. Root559]KRA81930.1 hypothetical protein ASD78_01260 [Lysobacter sp. Root667]KRC34834.1 hypothetical protein ASE10_09070 [Lysobacter sp. Root76]KRD70523.1 hypothetical protein ASE45_01240 [Lysobacter sp. Root96]
MSRRFRPCLLLALLALAGGAHAAEVTIYRCTDASGRLSLRDTPCARGEQQQTRAMALPRDPAPRPAEAVSRAEPPPPAAAPAPRTQVIVVNTPRPMYECVTPDGDRYTSETAEGNPRWVPLWTLMPVIATRNPLGDNVGGRRPPPSEFRPGPPRPLPPGVGFAYPAGTWVRDECHTLPQSEVCARLGDRRYELDRRYNSALQSERARIQSEQRGIDARMADDCGAY